MKRATGKSNLDIVKDYVEGNRPFIQVGYDPNLNNSKRKEGEEWEDGQGNKWVWKNGTKRKVSKLGQIKIQQRHPYRYKQFLYFVFLVYPFHLLYQLKIKMTVMI